MLFLSDYNADYCSSLLKEGILEALAHLAQVRDDTIQQNVFKSICSLCSKGITSQITILNSRVGQI
jgi:hypothetical protein